MGLENRFFLTWSEAANALGFDDEGLRQAMLVRLQSLESELWLPVGIDSKGRDYLACPTWSHNSMVQAPSVEAHEGKKRDAVFSDGSVFPNRGDTGSASWEATRHHREGYQAWYLLGGRLILSPCTVRYACQEQGEMRGTIPYVAPREWCADGFPNDGLHFFLPRPNGNHPVVENLYSDAFFYAEDVRRVKSALAAERSASTAGEHPSVPVNGPWPWGTHETELLRHLATAAQKWWALYDPNDATTAPTNAQVQSWLELQGVSERKAQIMASILRADGLPTGPRK